MDVESHDQLAHGARHRTGPTTRRWAAAAVMALVLAASGCGSDSDESGDASSDETTTAPSGDPAAEATAVDVTLTEEAVEGVPEELPAGLVEVAVTDETEGAGGEVNFSRVAAGTTEDAFIEGLATVFQGGPFPEFFENTAGTIGEGGTIVLDEGSYFVWMDRASSLERESTQDDIVTASLTVAAGDDAATLPDADGTVTATDYAFEIDAPSGPSTINFTNGSSEQFHHVLLADFGTNDPAVVEENLAAILQSEDGSMPEGIEGEPDFEAGGSSVFGPGGSGTFEADLVEGNTYVALCFISDISGGAPHAIQHDMTSVFVAGA